MIRSQNCRRCPTHRETVNNGGFMLYCQNASCTFKPVWHVRYFVQSRERQRASTNTGNASL